jgi:predicted deacylase
MENSFTRRQFTLGAATALGAIAANGMASVAANSPDDQESFDPYNVPAGEKQFVYQNIINNDATRLDMPIGVISGAEPGPTLAITGGIYATEYCGIEAASRMYRDFEPKKIKGRVIIVPVVNMPSFQFRTPMFKLVAGISPMDGKSINSVFPGDPNGSVTEVLAHYLFRKIVARADYHIDLRGGDLPESHVVHSIHPANASDKVNRISREMARACGYEYYQARMPNPGSLVYEASQEGVPSIITQSGLGYKPQPNEEYINLHILAVTNVMKHFKMMDGSPSRPKNQREFKIQFDRVFAAKSGIFQATADQGTILRKGQPIGRITGLDGSTLEELHSPIDGVVHELLVRRVVFQGDQLYNLVQFAD